MTEREREIFEYVDQDITLVRLIADVVELETQLDNLRKLPKIRVHPEDPARQKLTPAAKMYKEYLQQYINAIKVLQKRAGIEDVSEESPLRRWLNERMDA